MNRDFLIRWGWSSFFDRQIDVEDLSRVVRVLARDRNTYELAHPEGTRRGVLRPHWLETDDEFLPAVGDWVVVRSLDEEPLLIDRALERKSVLKRAAPGGGVQVIGVNLDAVFVVTSANDDFNLNRVERYLAMVLDGGIAAHVVVGKSDLHDDPESLVVQVRARIAGVSCFHWSADTGEGADHWRDLIPASSTVALVGSSGVGKSTLTNFLLDEDRQETQEIREDDGRGRHTTTRRQILVLPNGALLMDTPGMRELRLDGGDDGFNALFKDIEEKAAECRFRDCRHDREPGCAVRTALETGEIDPDRWRSYRKLERETKRIQAQTNPQIARELQAQRRSLVNFQRAKKKERNSRGV